VNGQIQYGLFRPLTSGLTPGNPPPPNEGDLQQRLAQFRHEVHVLGEGRARQDLERLVALASELHLREESIRDELAEIRASFDALELVDSVSRNGLPIVASPDAHASRDIQHFGAPVRFGRRRSDQFGHLELYSRHLKFRGALDLSVAWSEVAAVRRDGREMIVSLVDSRRLLRFFCASRTEAAQGWVIAEHLSHTVAEPAATR